MKFFLTVVLVLFGTFADAHQFVSDGEFTILQHSEPNDMPYAGTSTKLYFIFDTTPKGFSAEDCNCILYIAPYSELETIETAGERFEYGADVIHERGSNHVLWYTFPKGDVYALVVKGDPRIPGSFEAFRIVLPLRVEHGVEAGARIEGSEATSSLSLSPRLPTVAVFVILLLGILIMKSFMIRKPKK